VSLSEIEGWLALATLVAARVGPLTVLLPWLALRSAPATLRTALVLTLTLALAPLTASAIDTLPTSLAMLALLSLRELVVGTVFAVAAGLPFFALAWSGQLVDTWRGSSLAEVIAPPTGERTSPLGDLLLLGGVALFLALGGHRFALMAFAEGLVAMPVGSFGLAADLGAVIMGTMHLAGAALAFSVAIAAPAAVAIVLVELGLGLIARSAPQIPVFFAGMPLRAATGIFALLLAAALVVDELPGAFEDATNAAGAQIQRLSP
jgi:type III secretory pathway component EscT